MSYVRFCPAAIVGQKSRREGSLCLAREVPGPLSTFANCRPSFHGRHSTAPEPKCKRESLWTFWNRAGSSTATFTYDYQGRRTWRTDQNGETTMYAYGAAERLEDSAIARTQRRGLNASVAGEVL